MGLSLEEKELDILKQHICDQWLGHIKALSPRHVPRFKELGMARYHEASHLLDHASIWPKKIRILPRDNVSDIRKMSFMKKLEECFGSFQISDEENIGYEEIYWRLVR